jgi:tyrosinase
MADSLSYRQNIDALSAADLQQFRAGIARAMTISDNRGYQYFAGMHGIPQHLCHHHDILFLPWHRAYLYTLELSFRDLYPGFTLAYWDWTSPPAQAQGLPAAYTAQNDAASQPNPLVSADAQIPQAQIDQLKSDPQSAHSLDFSVSPPRTVRDTDKPSDLPIPAAVQQIIDTSNTFVDFSQRIEEVHDNIHGWVGGTMSLIPTAAYDPVFWAHHTMIDRLWYLWQVAHPGASVPASILHSALRGFTLTVADTLDINHLGYEYVLKTA